VGQAVGRAGLRYHLSRNDADDDRDWWLHVMLSPYACDIGNRWKSEVATEAARSASASFGLQVQVAMFAARAAKSCD
jgi:hypothetical protein